MHGKTVVALYDHFDNAKAAVADLLQAGAPHDKISLLANSTAGDHPVLFGQSRLRAGKKST